MTTITLTPYQKAALTQAIGDALLTWDDRIQEALRGERPALSVEGARLMMEDLKEVQKQIVTTRYS
jgi:hypothetical protein